MNIEAYRAAWQAASSAACLHPDDEAAQAAFRAARDAYFAARDAAQRRPPEAAGDADRAEADTESSRLSGRVGRIGDEPWRRGRLR